MNSEDWYQACLLLFSGKVAWRNVRLTFSSFNGIVSQIEDRVSRQLFASWSLLYTVFSVEYFLMPRVSKKKTLMNPTILIILNNLQYVQIS